MRTPSYRESQQEPERLCYLHSKDLRKRRSEKEKVMSTQVLGTGSVGSRREEGWRVRNK